MTKFGFALACSLLASAPCQATVRISVDLDAQRLTATRDDGGTVVWKISSGRPGYQTPTGHFSVMRLDADHYSDEYDQAPMPCAMFFSPRGLAIHGSYERGLGSPRSHGCVRLSVGNAEKLFQWVGAQGATIDIVGATPARASIGRERGRARRRDSEDQPEILLDQVYRY